jgi:hypothetical protein
MTPLLRHVDSPDSKQALESVIEGSLVSMQSGLHNCIR